MATWYNGICTFPLLFHYFDYYRLGLVIHRIRKCSSLKFHNVVVELYIIYTYTNKYTNKKLLLILFRIVLYY